MWISMSLELFVAQVSGISFIRKEVVLVLWKDVLGIGQKKLMLLEVVGVYEGNFQSSTPLTAASKAKGTGICFISQFCFETHWPNSAKDSREWGYTHEILPSFVKNVIGTENGSSEWSHRAGGWKAHHQQIPLAAVPQQSAPPCCLTVRGNKREMGALRTGDRAKGWVLPFGKEERELDLQQKISAHTVKKELSFTN